MKRIIAAASFVALGMGAVTANAQSIKGSDTLNKLTQDIIAACPGAAGLTYIAGGSGSGENALAKNQQQVAPMSRFLAANSQVCDTYTPDSTKAEGINVATDKLAIHINADSNKADCDPGSDVACAAPNGLAAGPITGGTANSEWKHVLRLIYFGLNSTAGNNPQNLVGVRNCNDPARVTLVNTWGNLFKNPSAACAAGESSVGGNACTRLRHAFRRDEQSGTTDAFRELTSANVSAKTGGNGYPFCNEYVGAPVVAGNACLTNAECALGSTCVGASAPTTGLCTVTATPATCGNGAVDANEECDDGNATNFDGCSSRCFVEANACLGFLTADAVSGGPGPAVPPYYEHYQDNDPIRRACAGNLNIGLGTSNLSTEKGEEVCGQKGDLGLVLPISVPGALTGVAPADLAANAYPTAICRQGRFVNGQAPTIKGGTALNKRYGLCPDGRVPRGTTWDAVNRWSVPVGAGSVSCPIPATDANDARCINGKNNKPAISASNFPSAACSVAPSVIDGRVFNLHLRSATGGYQKAPYAGADREIVGAFYRLHTVRSSHGEVTAGTNGTCTDGICCNQVDSTRQIGCLVAADNCSIGFAGIDGTLPTVDANALPVQTSHAVTLQGQSSSNDLNCAGYPMTRPLFLNTLKGFESVTGAELALAQCYSGSGLSGTNTITSLVLASEFIPKATGPACVDFEGCSDTPGNACAGNPAGIACQANADCASNNCVVTAEPGGRTKGNCAP